MIRRNFLIASMSPLISDSLIYAQDRDPVTVTAEGVYFKPLSGGNPWEVGAREIKLDGLTIPKFSINWIALNLATGILSGVGGFLFNLLEKALGFGGPTIEELLNKQLDAIANIVTDVVKNNEIRKDSGLLSGIKTLMNEYMTAPSSIDRLQRASTDSLYLIHDLATFGFETYQLLMCAGSLRLAILQERVRKDKDERTNFNERGIGVRPI